jgi:hypothetical protein
MKYNFDILLRENYPYEAPQITTRTRFGPVSLADGRDLFKEIVRNSQEEESKQKEDLWSP